ncbi:MAG TPA: mechanosensitive ion channel family protein [Baekduia sp.]|nr:mechanosensitive ion channel family protein [Baekduia sp.]
MDALPLAVVLTEADSDVLISKGVSILVVVALALVANALGRRGIRRALRTVGAGAVNTRLRSEVSLRAEQRIDALTGVLQSVASFVIFAIAAFMVLGEVGIELGPLIAGAGIVGVALGFGSQSLVKDFLSGMFILIEDQFGIGDIVDLDNQTSGTVEGVSLRTTRLRSVDGTVWHVPNGDIRRVGNKSQHWSRALLDVEVAYGTDLERAQGALRAVAHEVAESDEAVLEEPEVWGVERFTSTGVVLRLVVKTTPAEQYRVSRLLREGITRAFAAAGIEIPHVAATAPPAP